MKHSARPPKITDNDRLGMTATENDTSRTLDIILVQTHNPSEAEDARYLAQVSQQGGGDSEEQSRLRELFTAPTLADQPGLSMQTRRQKVSSQQQPEQIAMLHQQQSDYSINTDKVQTQPDELTVTKQHSENENTRTARLAQEISNIIENRSEKPKVKYMNSSTREFLPARYMREWINRVERIGNLNYPDQARRQELSGTLILDVAINSDGELVKIDLRKSSGHKVLDDAAQRIVKQAAPYSPFPAKLKREADVLHITRSWEFTSTSRLETR